MSNAQSIYIQAAREALTELETEFQEEMKNLEQQRDTVEAELSGSSSSFGGQVGAAASSSYETVNSAETANFNTRLREFSDKVELTIQKVSETTSSVQDTYSVFRG